jgi:hypothetical protein
MDDIDMTDTPVVEPVTDDAFLLKVLEIAAGENGVKEDFALGQNRGARVDEYIRSTHLDPAGNPPHGYPWCACFVYWVFEQTAQLLNQTNPCLRTAGVVSHWDRTLGKKILSADVLSDHSLVKPGMIFCKSHDMHSHTGIVCQVVDDGIITVEGNTNAAGSNEGNSVVVGKMRAWDYVRLGYIDYSDMSKALQVVSG